MDQEYGRSLAGCLWLKLSYEATVKPLFIWPRLHICSVKWCEDGDLHPNPLMWMLVGLGPLLPLSLPIGLPHRRAAGFLQGEQCKRKTALKTKATIFLWPNTSRLISSLCCTPFVRGESKILAQSSGERITQKGSYQEAEILGDQFIGHSLH